MLSPLFAVKLSPFIKEFNETSLFNLGTTGTPRPQSGDEGTLHRVQFNQQFEWIVVFSSFPSP